MSPDPTMDSTLPSTNSALFNIPKLAEDGLNWITYKERMLTVLGARGLMRYTDGRAVKPIPFAIDEKTKAVTKPDGSTPSQTEIDELDKKLDEFYQKDSLVRQQIFNTITDRMLLRIQKLDRASTIWDEICTIHEGKTISPGRPKMTPTRLTLQRDWRHQGTFCRALEAVRVLGQDGILHRRSRLSRHPLGLIARVV